MIHRSFLRGAASLALAACSLLASASSDVLVVDPAGGGDFTTIQDAVDAAADGDLVLIRSGSYGPVRLVGKGLSLVADEGATVLVQGGMQILNTLETHVIVLDGLHLEGSYFLQDGIHDALLASTVRGPLRVQDCLLEGAAGRWNTAGLEEGGEGAELRFVLNGSFTDCILHGGEGGANYSASGVLGVVNRAGHALVAEDSVVSVHGSELVAGDGYQPDISDLSYGGMAGHGARVRDAELYAAGSSFAGGIGGIESLCFQAFPGGHGIAATGPATRVYVQDCDLIPGGPNQCNPTTGLPSVTLDGAVLTPLFGPSRRFELPSPRRAGEVTPLTVHGEPGDVAWLLISFEPGRRDFITAYGGPLLVGTPLAFPRRYLGVVPASGSFSTPLVAPQVPALDQHLELSLQLFVLAPLTPPRLGNPRTWSSLDPSLDPSL